MSSFICSAKHFNSIEESIYQMIRFDRDFHCYDLKTKGFPTLYHQKDHDESVIFNEVKDIVDQLRDLNVICVSLQYKHHYDNVDKEIEEQKKIVHERKSFKSLDKTELFKALNCVNYQIEIEHLEDLGGLNDQQKRAMTFLDIIRDYLAYVLACDSPQYDKAQWEIN